MKKYYIICILLLLNISIKSIASQNVIYKWEKSDIILSLSANYGATLAEKIKSQNQREKAYHIFNLLCKNGETKSVDINLSSNKEYQQYDTVKFNEAIYSDDSIGSLSLKEVENYIGREISAEEKFQPVYHDDQLWYLKWSAGLLSLETDGVPVFQNEESYNFFGKKDNNILIRQNGILKYLDEAEWGAVDLLKNYTVSNVFKWIDKDRIVAYVESEEFGLKFIARVSIRGQGIKLLPDVDGQLVDFVVDNKLGKIYSLYYKSGTWHIVTYSEEKDIWVPYSEFNKRVYLLGIKKQQLILFVADDDKIVSSAGEEVKGIDSISLDIYPEGRYLKGETKSNLVPVAAKNVLVLFYSYSKSKALHKMGFDKIERLQGNPETWLLPRKYKYNFDGLPADLGHVFLVANDKKIYFDTLKNNIRVLGHIKLKPSIQENYILYFLGILLILLLLYDIFIKTKVYIKNE